MLKTKKLMHTHAGIFIYILLNTHTSSLIHTPSHKLPHTHTLPNSYTSIYTNKDLYIYIYICSHTSRFLPVVYPVAR